MTKIKLEPPSVGEKNTIAEPKVGTALKEVEKFLNEQKIESTDNIKPEGIAEASLAKALQEKFTTRLGFVYNQKNESFTAETEKFYAVVKAGATVTLPAPTANRIIAIFSNVGPTSAGVKVKPSAGAIYVDFINAAAEVTLENNQHLIVAASGTDWFGLAGEPKRTAKYTTVGYTKAEAEAGVEPSKTREAYVTLVSATEMEITVEGVKLAETTNSFTTKGLGFFVPAGTVWKANQEVKANTQLR